MDIKKKLGILAGVASVLLLAGCSGATPAATSSSSSSAADAYSGPLTITWKNTESAGLNALLPLYKKLHPGLDVTVSVADSTQLASTTRTQLSSGTASDIVWLWAGIGNPLSVGVIGGAGYLADLSKEPWAGTFPGYINPLTQYKGGKTGMLPMDITSFSTFYNDDAMKKAGLKPPTTWDQVLTFCKAATDKGVSAYAFGPATVSDAQNIVYNLAPTLVYGPDPSFTKNLVSGKATFSNTSGWLTTVDKYKQMLDAGCFPKDLTGLTIPQATKLVASGGALGYPTVGFTLSSLQAANPSTSWTWAPIPATNDAKKQYITASVTGGPGVSAQAKNKAAAIAFLNWLAEPAQMNRYVQALTGTAPSIPNKEFVADSNLTAMNGYIQNKRAVTFLNHYWTNPALEQTMQSSLQAMLIGSQSPKQVLANMTAHIKN